MDKLRKVGLTALAGTFAIGSAQALEMSASGSAGFTYSSSDDDEVTGERFSFGLFNGSKNIWTPERCNNTWYATTNFLWN